MIFDVINSILPELESINLSRIESINKKNIYNK